MPFSADVFIHYLSSIWDTHTGQLNNAAHPPFDTLRGNLFTLIAAIPVPKFPPDWIGKSDAFLVFYEVELHKRIFFVGIVLEDMHNNTKLIFPK